MAAAAHLAIHSAGLPTVRIPKTSGLKRTTEIAFSVARFEALKQLVRRRY